MNIQHHTKPESLLKYSFWWSQARLVIAAVALFIGGYPPLLFFNPISGLMGTLGGILTLCWIISGLASAYLLYRWNAHGRTVFGGTNRKDVAAFFVMIVSGFNLGLTGLSGSNIGMRLAGGSYVLFFLAGIVYLLAALHLHRRFKQHAGNLF